MKHKHRCGFTLIEVMIVITVIAVLASITIVAFVNVQMQSRDNARVSNALQLMNALGHFYNANGEYPDVCPGGDNMGCSASLLDGVLVPKYLPSIPSDPTGKPFLYVRGVYPNKSYGLLISYERTKPCKTGMDAGGNFTYNGSANTWWGPTSSTPICAVPLPNSA